MSSSALASSIAHDFEFEKNFGSVRPEVEIPNLMKLQKESYALFLQHDIAPELRKPVGLHGVFASIFPIKDHAGRATLEYISYHFGTPKYDVEECRHRGINYAAPIRIRLRLVVWDIDELTGARDIKGIKEQDVYMGDIPFMTDTAAFIINGTERVVVSQMQRSPGVFFYHDEGKTHVSGKFLFVARVIPYRGSWIDFEFDVRDLLYVRIDRKRKLYLTTFLKALGFTGQDILNMYYKHDVYRRLREGSTAWAAPFVFERMKGMKLAFDLIDAD